MSRRVLFFSDPIGAALTRSVAPWFKPIGVVTAEIRPEQFPQMKVAAESYEVPLLVQPRHHSHGYLEFVDAVRQLKPDIIFVNSYSMILRDDVLNIPSSGAVNVHGAPLPEFRGANPVEWGLIRETNFAGVSVHFMDSGIDSGDLIAIRRIPVAFEDTWRDVRGKVLSSTETLLSEILPSLTEGRALPRVKQDESKAQYNKRRVAADGTISWQEPIRTIHNMVRALVAPHPGTYVEGHGATAHFVRYHTLRELAAMKYAALGSKIWAIGSASLAPGPASGRQCEPSREVRVAENRLLRLHLLDGRAERCGDCDLHFDWSDPASKARAVLHLADKDDRPEQRYADLVRRFCREEFLRDVDVGFQ